MEKPQKKKNINRPASLIIWVGGMFSSVYLILVAIFISTRKGGLGGIFDLSLNEFGDFLAGICAPLAFLWLVIAVFVQRDELHAQLAEFKKSVEHAERHADSVEQQHNLKMKEKEKEIILYKYQNIASIIFETYLNCGESYNYLVKIKKEKTLILYFNRKILASLLSQLRKERYALSNESILSNKDAISDAFLQIYEKSSDIIAYQKIYADDEIDTIIRDNGLIVLNEQVKSVIDNWEKIIEELKKTLKNLQKQFQKNPLQKRGSEIIE